MKPSFLLIIFFTLCLASCNHKPTNPEAPETVSDTTDAEGERAFQFDSLMLDEYVVYSTVHYFSDSLEQDSFVIELPAGNVMHSQYYLRVFNPKAELIYTDSSEAAAFAQEEDLSKEVVNHEEVLGVVKRRLFGFTDIDNFTLSADAEKIKNAGAREIKNMIAFNEAVNDPARVIYQYDDGYSSRYIMFSQKLQKVVVVMEEEYMD